MKKPSLEQAIFFFGAFGLAIFFGWLFFSCFYFSDSFDIIAIKNIDEIVFQRTLLLARERLYHGNWIAVLANTDFGYGAIFWTPMTLFTWPIAAWGPDWLLIVMPRLVSVIAYVLCFIALYRICRRCGITAVNAMLVLILMASCRGIFTAALYFHNNTIISALILWSIYFLVLPATRKNRLWACLFFAMAIGMKISALFSMPIFLLFFYKNLSVREVIHPRNYLSYIKVVSFILFLAVIFFSPTVFLLPFGNLIFYDESLGSLFYIMGAASSPEGLVPSLFFENFSAYIGGYSFRLPIFISGFLAALPFMFCRGDVKIRDRLLPFASILSLLLMAVLVKVNCRDPYFLRFYMIPLAFTFSFIFVAIPLQFKKISIFLSAAIIINLFLGRTEFYYDLFEVNHKKVSADFQQKIQRFPELREKVKLSSEDIVNLDYRLLYPFGSLSAYKNVLFFYRQGESIEVKANVYMLNAKSMNAAEKEHFSEPNFEKIFADAGMEVFRRRSR